MPPRHPPFLLARRVVPLAVAVALATAAGACSKEPAREKRAATTTTAPTTTATAAAPAIAVTVTGVDANGTREPDEATVAAVKKTIDAWVAAAVVAPLHSGQPAGDLAAVFTPAALERLADPAVRAAMVDEGLPPATKEITAERANVGLFSVAGPDEVVAVIAAQLDLKVRAVGPTLDVDVSHYGELVLVQEGDGWKIDSFALEAARDSRA
jgi:hypothetical protein